jgi:hypothetical protein
MKEFATIYKDNIEYRILEARNVSLQQETAEIMIQHIHLATKKLMELAKETVPYIPIEIQKDTKTFQNRPDEEAELGVLIIDESQLQDLDKEFNYRVLRLGIVHELLHGIQDKHHKIRKRGFTRDKIVNTPDGNMAEILPNLGEMLYDTETYLEEAVEGNYDFTALNDINHLSIFKQNVAREIGIKTALQILLWEHPHDRKYQHLRSIFRKPYCHTTGIIWTKLLEDYTTADQFEKNEILKQYITKSGAELLRLAIDYERHIRRHSHRNI